MRIAFNISDAKAPDVLESFARAHGYYAETGPAQPGESVQQFAERVLKLYLVRPYVESKANEAARVARLGAESEA